MQNPDTAVKELIDAANSAGGNEIGASLGEISRRLEQSLKIGEKDGSNIIHTRYQGDIQVDSDEYEKYLGENEI